MRLREPWALSPAHPPDNLPRRPSLILRVNNCPWIRVAAGGADRCRGADWSGVSAGAALRHRDSLKWQLAPALSRQRAPVIHGFCCGEAVSVSHRGPHAYTGRPLYVFPCEEPYRSDQERGARALVWVAAKTTPFCLVTCLPTNRK